MEELGSPPAAPMPAHGRVFRGIVVVDSKGKGISVVTVVVAPGHRRTVVTPLGGTQLVVSVVLCYRYVDVQPVIQGFPCAI